MAKKQIKIWVKEDTLFGLKKGAGLAGKSLSEYTSSVLEVGPLGRSDLEVETIIKAIKNAFENRGENAKEISPKVERFLVATAAKIDSVLQSLSESFSGSDLRKHSERIRIANALSESTLKKIFGEENK